MPYVYDEEGNRIPVPEAPPDQVAADNQQLAFLGSEGSQPGGMPAEPTVEGQPVSVRKYFPGNDATLRTATPEEMAAGQATPGQNEVVRFPGSGLPGDQVKIRTTTKADIKAWQDNPRLAEDQALLAQARYGGDSDYIRSVKERRAREGEDSVPAPYGQPKGNAGPAPGTPEFNRTRFEEHALKQIGGNPFEIDVMKRVNESTIAGMPKLFNQVFQGKVIWEDRNKLNPEQAKYWQEELKQYRAHIKQTVESEKKSKIDTYHFMMKQFDAEQKETEAARKRQMEKEKEWMGVQKENRKDADAATKAEAKELKEDETHLHSILREKREILKRQGELTSKIDPLTGQLTAAASIEFKELTQQLEEIKAQEEKLRMKRRPEHREKRAAEATQKEIDTAVGQMANVGLPPGAYTPEPKKLVPGPIETGGEGNIDPSLNPTINDTHPDLSKKPPKFKKVPGLGEPISTKWAESDENGKPLKKWIGVFRDEKTGRLYYRILEEE